MTQTIFYTKKSLSIYHQNTKQYFFKAKMPPTLQCGRGQSCKCETGVV